MSSIGRPLPAEHHAIGRHGAADVVVVDPGTRASCAMFCHVAGLSNPSAHNETAPSRSRAGEIDALAGTLGVDVVHLACLRARGGAVGDFELIGERRLTGHRVVHRCGRSFGDQVVDVSLAHAGLTFLVWRTGANRSDRPVVSVQRNAEHQLAVVVDGLLGRLDRLLDERHRRDRPGLVGGVVVGHDADLIDVRRHPRVVVDPVAAVVGAPVVLDVRHADGQVRPSACSRSPSSVTKSIHSGRVVVHVARSSANANFS